jgi:hypothetical protein
LGFDSRRGLGIFLFTTASRTTLGPTQPPIQWVPEALSLRIKQPEREADYSPSFNAEVKECVELNIHSSNTRPWRGAQLKHKNNLTFYKVWIRNTKHGVVAYLLRVQILQYSKGRGSVVTWQTICARMETANIQPLGSRIEE